MNTVTAYGSKERRKPAMQLLGEEENKHRNSREPVCCAQGLNKAGLAGTEKRRGTYQGMRAERDGETCHICPGFYFLGEERRSYQVV